MLRNGWVEWAIWVFLVVGIVPAQGLEAVDEPPVSEIQIARWIEDLGNDDPQKRNAAQQRLIGMKGTALPFLKEGMSHEDAQIRESCGRLWKETKAAEILDRAAKKAADPEAWESLRSMGATIEYDQKYAHQGMGGDVDGETRRHAEWHFLSPDRLHQQDDWFVSYVIDSAGREMKMQAKQRNIRGMSDGVYWERAGERLQKIGDAEWRSVEADAPGSMQIPSEKEELPFLYGWLRSQLEWESIYRDVRWVATETINGQSAHKIHLSRGGETVYRWIGVDSHQLLKEQTAKRNDRGEMLYIGMREYRDFREVDGFLLPHEMETKIRHWPKNENLEVKMEFITKVTHVRINPDLDSILFEAPDKNGNGKGR